MGVEDEKNLRGIKIQKTGGRHWKGDIPKELSERLGEVSGFVLSKENEPTVYIVGDTIFNEDVKTAIKKHNPDIIIINSGGAKFPSLEKNPILMEASDVMALAKLAPNSKIVAVHMEALDHCTVTRVDLLNLATEENIKITIPIDGEIINF